MVSIHKSILSVVSLFSNAFALSRSPSLSARVGAAIDFLHARFGDVRVDLSGGEGGMTEELLNGTQIRPGIKEVSREGVAQLVR